MNKKKIINKLKDLTPLLIEVAILTLLAVNTFRLNALNESAQEHPELTEPPTTVAAVTPAEQEKAVTEPEARPKLYTEKDVELIGRTIWGEAGGVQSKAERAAVAWCILNRVDAFDQTIEEVVTAPHQFQGYRPEGDCPQEHLDLAADVLARWEAERYGETDVGRVLPADCLYFLGDGKRNHFTNEWQSTEYWGWTMADPYL